MQIRNIQKAFQCKFKPIEGISRIRMQIRTIRKAFESKYEPFERHLNANSNHSKSIRMQIQTIRKGFECKFEPGIRSIQMQIGTI